MSEVAKRLRDRRLNVWNENRALIETVAEENRQFTPEEQGKIDAFNEELDKLDERIQATLEQEQRAKAADDAFNSIVGKDVDRRRNGGEPTARDTTNDEIRAWFRGDRGNKPLEVSRNPSSQTSYRSLVTTNNASGGYAVPTDFYDQLLAHLVEVSGLMQAGPTILNTAGGESLQFPRTTAHTTAALTSQGSSITEVDPQFQQVTLGAYKYGAFLQVSRELLDDSAVDLIGYLAMSAGRAIGNAFGADLITGTGTNQPSGLIANASNGVTGTTTGKGGAAQYADLVNLEYSVIAPYRQSRSCYWLTTDKAIAGFRLLLDGNNRPVWEPSVVLGSPDLLLGKPLVADPFVPAVATSAKSVVFGDFAQFAVRLVGPIRFERSDDFAFQTDLVSFRAIIRGDGTLIDRTGSCMKYFTAPST
ncbi:MAG TPA: phage major capsid protein [Lentzea sp.]